MEKKFIRKSGQVFETLPNANFKVRLDDGKEVLCHLAGKLRIYRIKILPGDRVTVEMTPYDETRGRIVYREK
jgi:translation initiation factor IF-1